MIPVTYFPPATQRAFAANAERMAGRPYARFFDAEMVLRPEVLPALRAPMDPAHALPSTRDGFNSLLQPGLHEVEDGYCELPGGTAYVASRTLFPGATGEMFRWWFWWHSVESARYSLWYPYNHLTCRPVDRSVLTRPGLRHEQRYIGQTHHVQEYVGPRKVDIAISFVDPGRWGFDTAGFDRAGIVGHACADVSLWWPRVRIGTMVHLARTTDEGFELRSRYWLADTARLSLGRVSLDLRPIGSRLGITRLQAGERLGYEQLLHDQIEFTHLAGFLPSLYEGFGTPEPS